MLIRPLRTGDIDFLSGHLSAGELRTMRDVHGPDVSPKKRIAEAVLRSDNPMVLARSGDDRPLMIFGVIPVSLMPSVGVIWAMGTDEAFEHPVTLVREGRRYVRQMIATRYEQLVGLVDARLPGMLRYVRLLGFTVGEPKQNGPVTYYRYEMKRHV